MIAKTGKRTSKAKRATRCERIVDQKRATAYERPNGRERAKMKDGSSEPERAKNRERPFVRKRAIEKKRTTKTKRAKVLKGTIREKRGSQSAFTCGLVRLFYDMQQIRIGLGLKIGNPESNLLPEHKIAVKELYDKYEGEEEKLRDMIAIDVKKHPVFITWLSKIKGIDIMLSASLLYGGIDIHRATNASKMIRFCGLGTFEGRAERLVKGEKAHFSTFMKMTCWKVGKSFEKLKNNPTSIYGRYLQESLNKYHASNPSKHQCERCKTDEQKTAHINAMARRRTVALFLSHLWEMWRRIEDLPTGLPYAFSEYGGQHPIADYIPPMIDVVGTKR